MLDATTKDDENTQKMSQRWPPMCLMTTCRPHTDVELTFLPWSL
jgi:hypothetical protein